MFCLLSDTGICVGLITRPEESCRMWCASGCDRCNSIMGGPGPLGDIAPCKKELTKEISSLVRVTTSSLDTLVI